MEDIKNLTSQSYFKVAESSPLSIGEGQGDTLKIEVLLGVRSRLQMDIKSLKK